MAFLCIKSTYFETGETTQVHTEHTQDPRSIGKEKILWDYLQELLNDPFDRYIDIIRWEDCAEGIFKIVDPRELAQLWGIRKNHPKMTYDKLSRSLRYYYKTNKLRKVPSQRQVYQFIYSPMPSPNLFPVPVLGNKLNETGDQSIKLEHESVMIKNENVFDG